MRNLLVVSLLLVVAVVGVGYYLEWFTFSTSRDPETGRPAAHISVDQDKMKADAQKAKQKVNAASHAKEHPEGK
jgi:hypothetical protein